VQGLFERAVVIGADPDLVGTLAPHRRSCCRAKACRPAKARRRSRRGQASAESAERRTLGRGMARRRTRHPAARPRQGRGLTPSAEESHGENHEAGDQRHLEKEAEDRRQRTEAAEEPRSEHGAEEARPEQAGEEPAAEAACGRLCGRRGRTRLLGLTRRRLRALHRLRRVRRGAGRGRLVGGARAARADASTLARFRCAREGERKDANQRDHPAASRERTDHGSYPIFGPPRTLTGNNIGTTRTG
jgi:hypothetical protein